MSLLTPLLWSFVPSQLAAVLVPYATQVLPGLFPAAPKGTPLYTRNYRWIHSSLIVGYLAWTWSSGDDSDDWYALLGVPRWADDDTLKKAFRTLSRKYHPDRSSDATDGEIFIVLRRAYETLSEPTKRFAFDRFGPDILTWGLEGSRPDSRTAAKQEVGIRDWLVAGLMRSVGFYVVSGGVMAALAVVGRAREGASYRLLLLLLLLAAELTLLLAPTPAPYTSAVINMLPTLPGPLHAILQPILRPLQAATLLLFGSFTTSPQFIQIRTLHRLFTSLSLGISQLAGIWGSPEVSVGQAFMQATVMTKQLEADSVGEFHRQVMPILQGSDSTHAQFFLKRRMEEALESRSLSQHPGVKPVWSAACGRIVEAVNEARGSRSLADLEIARRIPLPPSPPPSPAMAARTL